MPAGKQAWQAEKLALPGEDDAAVGGHSRVHPVVVDVAVEDLKPMAAAGEADLVVVPVGFGEAERHHNVPALAFHPPLEDKDPVQVVDVGDLAALAAKSWLVAAQRDQLAGETEKIGHRLVAPFEAGP